MARSYAADSFFKNIVAAGIGQANSSSKRKHESKTVALVNNQNSDRTGNAYVDEILLDGDKQHEFSHHSGLKMLIDPVE